MWDHPEEMYETKKEILEWRREVHVCRSEPWETESVYPIW